MLTSARSSKRSRSKRYFIIYFYSKSNFLNPDVLLYAFPPPVRPARSGVPFRNQQEANFSPITSDEEGKPPKKPQQAFNVKQEEQQQQ
jgi:hypothetical protein